MDTECQQLSSAEHDKNGLSLLEKQTTENEHFFLFKETIKNTIEQTICGISQEQFLHIFSEISIIQRKPKIAYKLLDTFKKYSMNNIKEDLDDEFEEQKIEDKFIVYSKLLNENYLDTGNIKWRPPGDVKLHLRTPSMLAKLKAKQELEQYVFSVESKVRELQKEVQLNRNMVVNAKKQLKEILENNNNINNTNKLLENAIQTKEITQLVNGHN